MSTPDPDRENRPFEWRALTINKVERIQLERLHREQDRIEREMRERDAEARAERERQAGEREREELEQAWFDQGNLAAETGDQNPDARVDSPSLSPAGRLAEDSSSPARRLSNPPPKPRPSTPPSVASERSVTVPLVLAACAFGTLVYFSLRWVADIRQARVTQSLSSSVNAAGGLPVPPVPTLVAPHTPVPLQRSTVVPSAPVAPSQASSAPAGIPRAAASNAPSTGASRPTPAHALEVNGPSATRAPELQSPVWPSPTLPAALPTSGKPRVLVPASGSARTTGTRVYRQEE